MELTTTGLISEIQNITLEKLKAQTLLQNLELELQESDLQQRINKGKEIIKELWNKETEIRNQWIEILKESWIEKFESNWVEVRIKTSPWKLVITEEELIPEEYKKTTTKTTTTVDKKLIKENMKEWEIIDWCILEQDVKLEVKHK